MKKIYKQCTALVLSFLMVFAFASLPVSAQSFLQDAASDAQDIAVGSGYSAGSDSAQGDLLDSVNNIIRLVLTFLGTILFIIFLYAGFRYMTAGGNSGQTSEAVTWMRNAVIGLVIIFMAYAISIFVINSLQQATF